MLKQNSEAYIQLSNMVPLLMQEWLLVSIEY